MFLRRFPFLIFIAILASSLAFSTITITSCGRNSDPPPIDDDDDDDDDNNDDNDDWWDDDDDDDDDIKPECKDDGEWVTLEDSEHAGGDSELDEDDPDNDDNGTKEKNLEDCIISKEFDRELKIKVTYCAHWRDVFKVDKDILSFVSFANTQGGYIGSFAGLHPLCKNNGWLDKPGGNKWSGLAYVTIEREDGKKKDFTWKEPAFVPLNLGLKNMDPKSDTQVWIWKQIEGRAKMQYTNVNNNFGRGNRTHLFKIDDWRWGPRVYGFEFIYRYNVVEEGYYE